MKFKYNGEEYTEWFGHKWVTGTVHDVTDAHAIAKLKNSALFEAVGEEPKPVAVLGPDPEVLAVVDGTPEPVAPAPKKKRQPKEVVNDDPDAD